ncbi:MAG: hypothetical protein M3022_11230 [Actinomycetota bacterium]|nr:hypothetical protein [Actinomycetota bacterium]
MRGADRVVQGLDRLVGELVFGLSNLAIWRALAGSSIRPITAGARALAAPSGPVSPRWYRRRQA